MTEPTVASRRWMVCVIICGNYKSNHIGVKNSELWLQEYYSRLRWPLNPGPNTTTNFLGHGELKTNTKLYNENLKEMILIS